MTTETIGAFYDRVTCSWSKSQGCFTTDGLSENTLGAWSRSGIAFSGIAYPLAPLVRITRGTESGLLPTLTAGNKHSGYTFDELGGSKNPFRLLPTLTVSDCRNQPDRPGRGRLLPTLRAIYGEHPGMQDEHHLSGALTELMPTLAARDYKHPGNVERQRTRREVSLFSQPLPVFLGVKLTPNFCEAYMGFPIDHTALNPSEMPSSPRSSTKSDKPST